MAVMGMIDDTPMEVPELIHWLAEPVMMYIL